MNIMMGPATGCDGQGAIEAANEDAATGKAKHA